MFIASYLVTNNILGFLEGAGRGSGRNRRVSGGNEQGKWREREGEVEGKGMGNGREVKGKWRANGGEGKRSWFSWRRKWRGCGELNEKYIPFRRVWM